MGTAKRARQKANRQNRLQAAMAAQQKAKKKRQFTRVGIVALVVLAFLGGFALIGRGGGDSKATSTTSTTSADTAASSTGSTDPTTTASTVAPPTTAAVAFTYGSGECPPANVTSAKKKFDAAPKSCIDAAKKYTAVFETSAGTVKARLDTARTPGTTNNFVTLARYRYYDDSKLFRTDTSIGIIQGGGATNTDTPGYTIPDEGGKFTYTAGDLVMARTSQPNSAGGQFFFAVNDRTSNLDAQGTYVTFGRVTEGLDVLVKILASHKGTAPGDSNGAPSPEVKVTSIRIEES